MSRQNAHEFTPGDKVKFRFFPVDGEPIKRAGIVTGPDTENPGQMLIQADRTEAEIAADPDNANPAPPFSVWWAKGGGLVCGPAAPTRKTAESEPPPPEATAGTTTRPPAEPLASKPLALVHRGPHSAAVVDLVAKVFGGQAAAVTDFPLAADDGTTVYAFQATGEDLPALLALIEGEPSAAQCLAIIEADEHDELDELNAEREWPTLTAAN